MSADDCSIQQLVAQVRTVHFESYLLSLGWAETSSGFAGKRRFEADMNDGEGVYELFLPASSDVAKDRTRLLRNIYKLCGIEDREPVDIAREMIASPSEIGPPVASVTGTRLRVNNSGSTPLLVRVDSPAHEHMLNAREAIDIICASGGSIEIQRSDHALEIRTVSR